MAAAIGVADRVLAGEKRGAGALQARVRQGRVRAGGDRPRYQGPVEAVEDRRQIAFAAREPELGDVGQPEPVRGVGMEAALDQVVRRIGDLACVRAVPLGPLQVDDAAALLAHEAPYDLLGHDDGILPVAEPAGDVAVAPRTVGGLEYLDDSPPHAGVLVPARNRGALVLIGALGYPQGIRELSQAVVGGPPQVLDDQRLLPVGQSPGARGF